MVQICNKPYTEIKYNAVFDSWDFPLSDFQKYAIQGIVEGNHVLITAHTGSGKTLPAEYAIEYFVRQGKKLIYTTPIKALSNQKFNEFTRKFPHISFGILTGDIKFNPDADVLIMTTEILKNTLYHRYRVKDQPTVPIQFEMDIENDLGCVVFDEVHYINDADRGGVWEESIITLPTHIQMLMLSATIDRANEFAGWIETQKQGGKKVILASTNHRVVPLTHYSFVAFNQWRGRGQEIEQLLQDVAHKPIELYSSNGVFNEQNYYKIRKALSFHANNKMFVKKGHVLNSVLRYLRDNNMLPAITFIFSRKQVEQCAKEVHISLYEEDSDIPLKIEKECKESLRHLSNYQEYLYLPETTFILGLLQKGIAIHHAGMIPVLREMVEILFAKGYIKVLFATETFAVGINMPARSVIFTGLSKFNGDTMRLLHSHEYTQMAGRAGRRGIDKIGHVIHLNNLYELPTLSEYTHMLNGQPQKLISKFKISYTLLLNLIMNGAKDMSKFISQSMISEEIGSEAAVIGSDVVRLKEAIIGHEESLQYLKTPIPVLYDYKDLLEKRSSSSNKQRRRLSLQVFEMEEKYHNIMKDYEKLQKIEELKTEMEEEARTLDHTLHYIDNQINSVMNILCTNLFASQHKDYFKICSNGIIAAHVQEIHCLVFVDMYRFTDTFTIFTPIQLVGLFSCCTSISIKEEYRAYDIHSQDQFLETQIRKMKELYEQYMDHETNYNANTGSDYNIHFELIDDLMNWCLCENEEECKELLYNIGNEKQLFMGEFIKALLKVNNIASELERVCEVIGDYELKHKLQQIPEITMKYIVTNQSLYV